MQTYDSLPDLEGKQITCRDCNFRYWTRRETISSTCERCGNINYHPSFSTAVEKFEERKAAIMPGPKLPLPTVQDWHENFYHHPDISSEDIDAALIQYQQEWQLWSAIVKDFKNINLHLAYLTFTTHNLNFDKAVERYRSHQKHMVQLTEHAWEADIAEEMLDKLVTIACIQWERSEAKDESDFLTWAWLADQMRFRQSIRLLFLFWGASLGVFIFYLLFWPR